MECISFLIFSALVGLLPESIYFTMVFIFAKGLKTRRIALFFLIFCVFVVLGVGFAFTVWFHILAIFSLWLILRILYRAQVVDVALITFSSIVLNAQVIPFIFIIEDMAVLLIVTRILFLLSAIAMKGLWSKLYAFYLSVWNRGPDNKIKSLTARNIVIVSLNLILFVIYAMISAVHGPYIY